MERAERGACTCPINRVYKWRERNQDGSVDHNTIDQTRSTAEQHWRRSIAIVSPSPEADRGYLQEMRQQEAPAARSPPPPSSAATEDQPQEAAPGNGPTAAPVANTQEGARQPSPAPAAEQPPPRVPVDDSRLKSQTSSSTDEPAPVRQSFLRKVVMESPWMKLEGKGELEIEEAGSSIDSKSHPDGSPDFAIILLAADAVLAAKVALATEAALAAAAEAALAAAAAKRQAEGQSRSSSSDDELLDTDNPANAEESSTHAKPSSSSVSEPKTEKEKEEEKEEEEKK